MNAPSTYRVRVLHISDLHMTAGESWARRAVLGEAWKRHLHSMLVDGPIDLVCFTGDVAQGGAAAEYDAATPFFTSLLDTLGLDADRLCIVPGNHDVDRDRNANDVTALRKLLSDMNTQQFSRWIADSGKPPPGLTSDWLGRIFERSSAYRAWLKRAGFQHLLTFDLHPRLGYRLRVVLPERPFAVHVLGLDSAWLCDRDDHENILLTDDQIGALCTPSLGDQLHGWRLALLHHPLSSLWDGMNATDWLRRRVDLVLHGHVHQEVAKVVDEGLPLFGASCLYEGSKREKWPNGHNLIEALLDGNGKQQRLDLHRYVWAGIREGWRPCVVPPSPVGESIPPSPVDKSIKDYDARPNPAEIRTTMTNIVTRYGKIGLLVDDADDAEPRVARELYGTEGLPSWWCVARTIECATVAVQVLQELLHRSTRPHGVLVVDRYLLRDHHVPEQTVALDVNAGPIVSILRNLHDFPRLACQFVTTYDRSRAGHLPPSFWKPRRNEPVREMRVEQIENRADFDAEWRCLLRRGPDGAGARWWKWIDELGRLLAQKKSETLVNAALLTGWGASQANGQHGSGLPAFRFPLQPGREACRKPCVCSVVAEPSKRESAIAAVSKFSQEGGSKALEDLDHLERCRSFKHHDTGFPYQHWLMARLPWRGLFTLNPDSFHERAALAVSDIDGDGANNLGVPGSLTAPADAPGKLFKLLGNYFDPGTSARDATAQGKDLADRLKPALRTVLPTTATNRWLLLVGTVESETTQLLELAAPALSGCRVYWVDETADEARVERAPNDALSSPGTFKLGGIDVTAFRGSSLDFAFDLWSSYRAHRGR